MNEGACDDEGCIGEEGRGSENGEPAKEGFPVRGEVERVDEILIDGTGLVGNDLAARTIMDLGGLLRVGRVGDADAANCES